MLATREHQFIAMHTEHFGRVYRYIAYRIGDAQRAEELASDVFRIAWEKQNPDVPGIGWLIATARNLVGNEYRGRHREHSLTERLADQARAAAQTHRSPEAAAVADVLSRLSDTDREVLMLSYWDELTTAELAASLGCSVSAARVRLHRARKAFASAVPSHLMSERQG
jgi:RNA polymerase sigma-70 factor (ECF subfamily)